MAFIKGDKQTLAYQQLLDHELKRIPKLPISKEKVIKTLNLKGINMERLGNIELKSTDNTQYIELVSTDNMGRLIRIINANKKDQLTWDKLDFSNVTLPLLIHAPDIDIKHIEGTNDEDIDIVISDQRKVTLIVHDLGEIYRIQYFNMVLPRNISMLMDVFDINKETGELTALSKVHDDKVNNEESKQAVHYSTLNQISGLCVLNLVSNLEIAQLALPSKLKLRNVSPAQHDYHRPHILLPMLKTDVSYITNGILMYDPRKCMDTLLLNIEKNKEYYEDAIPFFMTFEDLPVTYTPTLFKYLPFNKFIVIDNNFLADDGARFFTAYSDGVIRIGMYGADTSFEMAMVNIKHIVADKDGGVNVTKYVITDEMANRYADVIDDRTQIYINSLVGSLICFLIHYGNLEPMYHEDPSIENHYRLHEALDKENTYARTTRVVKLNHPRKLQYRGRLGGTHASPEEHQRRGHWRTYKSGKRTFVNETTVNKGSGKTIKKVYLVE